MKDALLRLASSMKFWTLLLGIVSALSAKYGLQVDPEVYWSIVGLFGLLLGAQGLQDHGKEAAKETAKASVAIGNLPATLPVQVAAGDIVNTGTETVVDPKEIK